MYSIKRPFTLLGAAIVAVFLAACGGFPISLPSLQPTQELTVSHQPSSAPSPGPPVAQAEGESTELTVYNQNMALVKDRRTMSLDKGVNEVRFTDVASQIDPTSVHFSSLTDPGGTSVLEQNYEYDIVGSHKLLQKYVDQEIILVTEDGTTYEGTLLSGSEDIILSGQSGEITMVKLDTVQEFRFPELPSGLITRPTLVWQLESGQTGDQDVEVTYMTNGINWYANYVVVSDEADEHMDLTGWVTVDNRSGATYEDARLKLIAGDVHRETEPGVYAKDLGGAELAYEEAPSFEEQAFFEYHMYTLQRPATVKDNQTKQIEFVNVASVPVNKFYVYDGAQQLGGWGYYGTPYTEPEYGIPTGTKVYVMLEFYNKQDAGMGLPLPKGTIRAYKKDHEGGIQLIGEDSIDHTPKDERVLLYLGDAFDIVGERRQTDFEWIDSNTIEESFEIKLRNHKEESLAVRVVEHLYRWSAWEIRSSNHDYEKKDARTIEFPISVPKDGETTVTYTVRYSWK
jgi:hypothetical protein